MAQLIKDPIDGQIRLAEEQITKNAIDINNLRIQNSEFNDRLGRIEAGANLGGANLVRFAFNRDDNYYYNILGFSVTIPSGWNEGDYIEIMSTDKNDIPAYGHVKDGNIQLQFKGDFIKQYTTLIAVNTKNGSYVGITSISWGIFLGTSLLDIDPQTHKSQIVNVLKDVFRDDKRAQYVSFDLNNDGIWTWVYIGTSGSDGNDGANVYPCLTESDFDSLKPKLKIGDSVLFTGSFLDYDIGDIYQVLSISPALTIAFNGNIRGPKGDKGEKGDTGKEALSNKSVISIDEFETGKIVSQTIANFNRTPDIGDIFISPILTSNNKSYIGVFIVEEISSTVTCKLLNGVETTGIQGPTGEKGDSGIGLIPKEGIWTIGTLPSFESTEVGDAYVVLDTSGPINTYTLYYHGEGATDWTVVDNWAGVPGPAPTISITSTPLPPGSNSYATLTNPSPGHYIINLYLASGADGASTFSSLTGSPYDNAGLANALDSKQDKLIAGDNITIENNVISASGGGGGTDSPYDLIIRTQAEFEDLIASPTWFDAKSVALVGQFTLSTANNSGVKIPATVKQIHGFNGAKITITNFRHNATTAKGGLWYDEKPEGIDYEIRNLEVNCRGTSGDYGYGIGCGFRNCTNLTNCIGSGIDGYGFYNCTNLTNCTGTGTGNEFGYGFYKCTNLTNCTGTGNGDFSGFGFNNCANLTNCTGTGSGGGSGYGFYNCSYANGCKSGTTPSKTAIWGGTNTKIDEDSCEMDV